MTSTGSAPRLVETDVVVVGGGPVGLLLAVELRLGGADVVVLERLAEPTTESRASTLHARTMELLAQRGLVAALGSPPNDRVGHFGGIPLDLTLPGPYPGQWKVPQAVVERVLAERATRLGADLRRGHDVVRLDEHPDHVDVVADGPRGPVVVRGRYAVGCDGEESAVRGLAGFDFPGVDASRTLIRADVAGIDVPARRFQRLERGLAIAARMPDGVTRVMVHEFRHGTAPDAAAVGFPDLVGAWARVTGEDISHGTPLWVNAFGDGSRQAAEYRRGRVLLAGDAAHRQMPIGGQALNLGLQDAVNLGWKLAVQVRRAPEGLLDTYQAERHPVGERVLANIEAQALLLLGDATVEPVRTVLAELLESDEARAHLAGMISGLDVRHGDDPSDPLVGTRMPHERIETPEGPTTTTAFLHDGRGLLLEWGASPGRFTAEATGWADRVRAVVAAPPPESPLAKSEAVLVRPDGYLAWTARSDLPLTDVLSRWFGPSTEELPASPIAGGQA